MRPLSFILFIAVCIASSSLVAADAAPDDGGAAGRGRDRMLQRLIAEHPELKDVDPSSEDGRAKIQAAMQADMRKRMTERQAANHAKLKTSFGMKDEEFAAIEPLLNKVETLRLQKMLIDPAAAGMPSRSMGGPGGEGRANRGPFNPQALLGNTALDPAVKEVQDATKALKALVDDAQANATEVAAAVTRVRKAREAFNATLTKAQEELRSVLTPRQEAILIDQGALE
jgi:Spy/CpxP family protein refolding chaperone